MTVNKSGGVVSYALLTDKKLSQTSRLVGAWFESKSNGSSFLLLDLVDQLGITKDAWQKARRELMEAGYLTVAPGEKTGGRFQEISYVFQVHDGD